MQYEHVHCGGTIDTKKRQCTKCKKKFGRIEFYTNLTEIRPVKSSVEEKLQSKLVRKEVTSYAKWADRLPFVSQFASKLPSWPRWARIVSTFVVYGGVVAGLVFLIRSC